MAESRRSSFFSTKGQSLAKKAADPKRSPSGSAFFRCGLLNIHASKLSLPSSVTASCVLYYRVVLTHRDASFNSMFRFTFDGRAYKTPVAKKSKDPRFPTTFEWVWHCDPSNLASNELVVDYAFTNKGKTLILGKASVDALSLATGPVKWELELFSSKEHESVGFIHFEFHMEQFTQPSLHLEFSIVPEDGTKICDQLFPETVQLPVLTLSKIKNLPRERSKSLDSLHSDKFVVDTKFQASMKGLAKGGLLVILKPKNKKVARDLFAGSYFRVPFGEVMTVEPKKIMTYRANVARQGKVIGHADISCTWTNMSTYAQMVEGYYNSRKGIVGGQAVPGVHQPVIRGEKQAFNTEANLTISHVIEVGNVNEIHDVQDSDDDDFNFNMNLPAGWEEIKDASGKVMYKNFITGHTQAHHPMKAPGGDDDEIPVSPPKLSSKPSQFFGGFSNQVDDIQIDEAKQFSIKKPTQVRETIDDDWAEAGSGCDEDDATGDNHTSASTVSSYPHVPPFSSGPASPRGNLSGPRAPPGRPTPPPPGTPAPATPSPLVTSSPPPTNTVNPFTTMMTQSGSVPPSTPASPPPTSTPAPTSPTSTNPTTPTPGLNPFLTMMAGGAPPATPTNPLMTTNSNPLMTTNPFQQRPAFSAPASTPFMTNTNPMMTNSAGATNPVMMTNRPAPGPGVNPFLTMVQQQPQQTQPQTSPTSSTSGISTDPSATVNPFM